jgi:hypothetical protein
MKNSETIVVEEQSGGKKGDGGKRQWDLVDFKFLDDFIDVLTFGATKYAPDNWKKVSRNRYEAALMRHWSAYLQGEQNDPETGLPHLAHMTCSLMFLNWFDNQKEE